MAQAVRSDLNEDRVQNTLGKAGRRSDVDVDRLQITLAKADGVQLDRVVRIGKFGRNRNEVAARIISDWLHDQSQAELDNYLRRLQSGEDFDAQISSRGGPK